MKDELTIVDDIRNRFHLPANLGYGIGDDSAILNLTEKMLITVDSMIENVHFDLSYTSFYNLGFKIVSVNVSDVYAMGGEFIGFLLSVAIPERTSDEDWRSFLNGVNDALELYGGYLIGGDLSKSKQICLTGIAIGQTENPVFRKGAQPGDFIFITSPLGLSACGLEILKNLSSEEKKSLKSKDIREIESIKDYEEAIRRHLMPIARNSRDFKDIAKAMIDISDGLLLDLYRICRESGVGAEIYLNYMPLNETVKKAASFLKVDPMKFIISGGEDYELLVISDKVEDAKSKGLILIGRIIKEREIYLVDSYKGRVAVKPEGWLHF